MQFSRNRHRTTARASTPVRSGVRASFAAAALIVATAPAAAIEPFTAVYQASYMGMQAEGQMKLVATGANRWKYSLDISNSLAKVNQSTVFEEHDGGWRPLSGNDTTTLLVKNSKKIATYDWTQGMARWTGDVKPERAGPVKLRAGDMDAMLLNLALARDVSAGKPLSYRLVENGRAKQHVYKVAGTEQVTVGGKQHEATKVVRTDDDKQTVAWVVKGMPVPARILQREKGRDKMDLRLKSID